MLCQFREKESAKGSATLADWLDLVLKAQDVLSRFFHQDGKGLSMQDLGKKVFEIFTPLSACFEMDSSDLIGYFVAKAAELHKLTFLEQASSTDGQDARKSKYKRPEPEKDALRSAGAAADGGTITLRILCFDGENTRKVDGNADDTRSQVKSIRFTVVRGNNLGCSQSFVKVSAISKKDSTPRNVFTTKTVKAVDRAAVFEEGFTVHDSTADMALQIRVCSPGAFICKLYRLCCHGWRYAML